MHSLLSPLVKRTTSAFCLATLLLLLAAPAWSAETETSEATPSEATPSEQSPTPGILGKLISEGIDSSPQVNVARTRLRAARLAIDSARWAYWPTPSVSIERTSAPKYDTSYAGNRVTALFKLRQTLWDGGGREATLARTKSLSDSSRATLEATQLDLALAIVDSYGTWLSAWRKYEAWQRSQIAHEKLLAQIERRVLAGLSSNNDLDLAYGRVETVRSEVSVAVLARQMALLRLSQLLGVPLEEDRLIQTFSSALPLPVDLVGSVEHALSISPHVRVALAEVRTAEAMIAERKAELFPRLTARVEHQRGAFSNKDFDKSTRFFVGMESRFGPGFSNFSRVEESEAVFLSAQAEVAHRHLSIRESVESNYKLTLLATQRIDVMLGAVSAARAVLASYERQFATSGKSWVEVMSAHRELTTNEVQLSDSLAARLASSWKLALHVRGIFSVSGRVDE